MFGVTQDVPFVGTNYGLVTTNSVQGSTTLTADGSDRLGCVIFAKATASKTINFVHNGALRASRFTTPLITLHGNLAGLQGGTGTVPTEEYYHLTAAERTRVTTSKTLHSVLLGNTTSAPEEVAPSTSGNVLTSNGTTWTSAAPTGGGGDILSMQVFT